jgi:hypothetical protein
MSAEERRKEEETDGRTSSPLAALCDETVRDPNWMERDRVKVGVNHGFAPVILHGGALIASGLGGDSWAVGMVVVVVVVEIVAASRPGCLLAVPRADPAQKFSHFGPGSLSTSSAAPPLNRQFNQTIVRW